MIKKLDFKKPARLTFKTGNPKTDKNLKDRYNKYWILRLNLAPHKISGYNVCPSASAGCSAACLHTAGNPIFQKQKDIGRINRTRYYIQEQAEFVSRLIKEIGNHEKYCVKNGFKPVVRLNTTSDVSWENHGIFDIFPNVQFYDYTKVKKRALKFVNNEYPKNYHITFSMNECNQSDCMDILEKGGNVAMVFRKDIPDTYKGYKVVSGDDSDLRFLDPKNSIIGLKAKGKAKKDVSGFVV